MKALLAALFTISLHAQELTFWEKFASPDTRTEALQRLTPLTRDWFYYHALDQQLRGDDAAFSATMKEWKRLSENPQIAVSTQGFSILENRQLLLRAKTNPDATITELTQKLDLSFDYEKSSIADASNEPSTLDPKLISPEAFEAEILKNSPEQPWKHFSTERLLAELPNAKKLSNEKRLTLLHSLPNSAAAEAFDLIALCLETNPEHRFGNAEIHQSLTHEQLLTLLKRLPKLADSQLFAQRYLQTMRPSDESNYLRDPQRYLAHLQACDEFLRARPPVFTPWKADCLWQKLLLQQKLNQLSREDLLRYLALPLQGCPLLRVPDNALPQSLTTFAQPQFDVIGGNLTGGIDDLESMLIHFLRETQEPGEFAQFIPEGTLKKLHAKAHLLKGDEDNKWAAAFSADELKELREQAKLTFAAQQTTRFSPQDEVVLLFDCKNTPKVTIRIFELDLLRYLRHHNQEPDASIELDGLVPHVERTLTFAQAPVVAHRESIAVPELKGRGVWVVECVSGGIASRALIRKGDLIPHIESTSKGQVIRLFDEAQQPISAFRLHTNRETLTSQADGTILIPFTKTLSVPQNAVIEVTPEKPNTPTLAKRLFLGSTQADYQFYCGFHIDREQLIADQTARLVLHPRLLINDQPCPLDAIKSASITVTAQLLSGATSDHVITPKEIKSVMTAEFTMPRDATSLQIKIEAQIPRPDDLPPFRLQASQSYEFNQALASEKIYSSFFVQTTQGHRLEILGRNGEPGANWPLSLQFKHRLYHQPLSITLQTNQSGVIELGDLKDIEMATLESTVIATVPYRPHSFERITLPQAIHASADQVIRIPLAKHIRREGIRLVETTTLNATSEQFLPTRDHRSLITFADDMLVIQKIPAGNFQLTIDDTIVPLRISPAKPNSSLLVSPQRILHASQPSALHIAGTVIEGDTIKIRLKQSNEHTRVSVVASQFFATPPLSDAWDRLPNFTPAYKLLGFQESSFLNNRVLDEEMRYVIDRRSNKTFPGNMLPNPGLLVHRANYQYDFGSSGGGFGALPGALSKKSEADRDRKSAETTKETEPNRNGPLYDFLSHGSAVFYDLKPDANGVVTLDRKKIPDARMLTICAAEGHHYHQTTVPLEPTPLKKRARQLQRALDPTKHFIGTQRAVVLQKDQSESINNMLDARWKEYATLDDVFRLFVSSAKGIFTLSFLPKWNTLDEAQKIELYQLHACHELHVFLARKDRKFFDQFVKPNLAQKRELSFIDHYLLDHDLSEYLNQKEWQKLNAAERALLCQAMPAAAERISKEMQYELLKFPLPLDQQAFHFTKALEGSALSLSDRADLASLEWRSEQERYAQEEALRKELAAIIIPSINFENTPLSEAVATLQTYAPQITLYLSKVQTPFGESLLPPITDSDEMRVIELKLTNVPFFTALKYICDSTKLKYSMDRNTITIRPVSDEGEELVTRTITVPPDIMEALSDGGSTDASADPFATTASTSGGLRPRANIMDLLKSKGIPFPGNASATFIPASSTLIVRNTPTNLDMVESITHVLGASAPANALQNTPAKGLALNDPSSHRDDPFASASDPFSAAPAGEDEAAPFISRHNAVSRDHKTATKVYEESQYWKHSRKYDADPFTHFITINRFWMDLAQWDGKGAFLSTHFTECMGSDNEMLLALALLDLPFTKEASETTFQNDALSLKAKQPLLLFYRDTRESDKIIENSPILVRQTFYPDRQRYSEVNGRQIENTITDGIFSPHTAYGSALIIANPTGETRQVQLLWQIPAGALPLEGKPATDSVTLELPPYSNEQLNFSFYFPEAGEFTCYPFHVSENDTVLAFPQVSPMRVTNESSSTAEDYFYELADDGNAEKLLEFLRTKSLFDDNHDLYYILWRLKDRAFYDRVIAILNDRLYFHEDVFSFAFYHRDQASIRRYLENSSTVRAVGPWLESPFLQVTAPRDLNWFDQEFDPFINNRAHRLGKQDQLPLDLAKTHYIGFLEILCHKTELSADDQLQLCYFLILQNRTADAVSAFAKIDRAKLAQHLHYDYLRCYLLFSQEKPAEAKAIAVSYEKHPVRIWQQRFQSVINQADEIAKPVIATATPETNQSTHSFLTMAHKANGKIVLSHQGLKEIDVQLYQVDMEMLFTANPFLDQNKVLHHAIRPNKILNVKLSGKETTVDLPADYAQGNVIAAVESGSTQVLQTINSGKFAMTTNQSLGEIQVIEQANSKVLPQTYVKVYARLNNDSVQFYKDGYTDLRGKFNFRAHNNIDPAAVKQFSLLLSHPTLGTRIERIE